MRLRRKYLNNRALCFSSCFTEAGNFPTPPVLKHAMLSVASHPNQTISATSASMSVMQVFMR